MKVGRRCQSGDCSNLHSIGESGTSAIAVDDLNCVGDIADRVLFLNWQGQRVGKRPGLRLRRARWLSGAWRRRLPDWIPAFLHVSLKTSADACRAKIAHGLAVRGTGGYRPSQRHSVSLSASTEIGGWFRKFGGWRQRGACLGASGEQDAERRRQTEFARQSIHRKRKSIRGALWALRNPPNETLRAASLPIDTGQRPHPDEAPNPSIPAPPRGISCCANLRPRAWSR